MVKNKVRCECGRLKADVELDIVAGKPLVTYQNVRGSFFLVRFSRDLLCPRCVTPALSRGRWRSVKDAVKTKRRT